MKQPLFHIIIGIEDIKLLRNSKVVIKNIFNQYGIQYGPIAAGKVSDGRGRMIMERVLTGTQSVQLDISSYAKGIYYVEAVTAEERKVEKVLRK